MKTRAEIYGQEATDLLREIAMYPGLIEQQLERFHPGREDKVRKILSQLIRQGRITRNVAGGYFQVGREEHAIDTGLIRAVWVLLDFIGRVEYHSTGDFPVKLIFFVSGEVYEVVYAAFGQEQLVSQVLRRCHPGESRRIVLVEDVGQIPLLNFPDISGFCMVEPDGKVSYYKKAEEECDWTEK